MKTTIFSKTFNLILFFVYFKKQCVKASEEVDANVEKTIINKKEGDEIVSREKYESNLNAVNLNFWIDDNRNLKALISTILENSLNPNCDYVSTKIISNIYQLALFKKTFFLSVALEFLILEKREMLNKILKGIEIFYRENLLMDLLIFEKYVTESDFKFLINNMYLLETHCNRFHFILLRYIRKCRQYIFGKFEQRFTKYMFKHLLAQINHLNSLMIDTYCRVLSILENRKFKKVIEHYRSMSNNTEIQNLTIIINGAYKELYNGLEELMSFIYYCTNKYNTFINKNINKIVNIFDYVMCPITSEQLVNVFKTVLYESGVVDKKFKEEKNLNYFFYFLQNDNKNKVDFLKLNNGIIKCFKSEFSNVNILNIHLKEFKRYESVLNHIKVSIKIKITMTKNQKTNYPIITCFYTLKPSIIKSSKADKHIAELKNVCDEIRKISRRFVVEYDHNGKNNTTYSEDKRWRYYTIGGENFKHLIYEHQIKNKNLTENLCFSIKAFENRDKNGCYHIVRLNVTKTFSYFYENLSKQTVKRTKTFRIYPEYEYIYPNSETPLEYRIREYAFSCYVYNPQEAEYRQKSYIFSNLMFKAFSDTDMTKKIMFNSINFVSDWFETNILHESLSDDVYTITPYKHIASWITYFLFRSILKKNKLPNESKYIRNDVNNHALCFIIRKYECLLMTVDPFFYKKCINENRQTLLKKRKITSLFWSDKMNCQYDLNRLTNIYRIPGLTSIFNLLFFKLSLVLNNIKIGHGDITVLKIDSFTMRKPIIQKRLDTISGLRPYTANEYINIQDIKRLI